VPLTDLTHHLIDARALEQFQSSGILINTARGAVVDNAALAEALSQRYLAGAAVDVFDEEPPGADHPLRKAPNCLLSPHVGSRTAASLAAMNDVVDDVIAVLANRAPAFPAP
jgi:phosphoglycerate dehydrogenase-like enzyme